MYNEYHAAQYAADHQEQLLREAEQHRLWNATRQRTMLARSLERVGLLLERAGHTLATHYAERRVREEQARIVIVRRG